MTKHRIKTKEDEEKIIEDIEEEQPIEEETQNYLEMLQRVQAEFDNYKKRNADLERKCREDGIVYAVSKILPVLDSFYNAQKQNTNEDFLKSSEPILNQLNSALKEMNIEKIETENKEFNPHFHNAVLTSCEEDKPDNSILDTFQEGYKINDRVIRYSVVKINKK